MKGIKIGQLSDMLGIPASAIRYYEACGLVSPVKDPGTGYRYYSPTDCEKLMCARTFRSMSFSIQESRALMSEREMLPRLALWARGRDMLDGQIARLEAQKRALEYWQDLSVAANDLRHTCRTYEREGFYHVSLGKRGRKKTDKAFNDAVARWIEYMPESSYWGLFDVEALREGRVPALESGFGIRESCVRRERIEIPPCAAYYPPCACLQTTIRCDSEQCELPPEAFEHVVSYADEHGFRLTGTGNWHFLQLFEDGGGLYAFSFPIEE